MSDIKPNDPLKRQFVVLSLFITNELLLLRPSGTQTIRTCERVEALSPLTQTHARGHVTSVQNVSVRGRQKETTGVNRTCAA